jgi:drug/metabolite transporter, DME family
MILFVQGNKLTTAASTIFLQSTAPLYVLLLSPWLLGERVRWLDLATMGVLGLGLASFFVGVDPATATAPNPLLGNVLSALSGLTWGAHGDGPAGARTDRRGAGRRGRRQLGAGGGLVGERPGRPGLPPGGAPLGPSRPLDWLLVGFLGVFQIAVAYVFLLAGLARVRALEASLLLLLEPVLNPVWAWLVHGERPGAWALAGGAAILLATSTKAWLDARRNGGRRRAALPAPEATA